MRRLIINENEKKDILRKYGLLVERKISELPQDIQDAIKSLKSQGINISDENIEREFLEDYAIGFNLSLKFKQDMLLIATNKYFTDIELSDFPKLVQENKI